MSYPAPSIQTAIIARLRGDATLQGLLGGSGPTWNVFDADGVPGDYPCPYVATFPITSQSGEDLSFGTDAVDIFQQVSVFTQSKGFAQARTIAKQVYALLHEKALDLLADGFNQYLIIFDQDQELPDGIYQHIPMRFALKTQG